MNSDTKSIPQEQKQDNNEMQYIKPDMQAIKELKQKPHLNITHAFVLTYIARMLHRYGNFYQSNTRIAKELGYHVDHMSRVVNHLKHHKWLKVYTHDTLHKKAMRHLALTEKAKAVFYETPPKPKAAKPKKQKRSKTESQPKKQKRSKRHIPKGVHIEWLPKYQKDLDSGKLTQEQKQDPAKELEWLIDSYPSQAKKILQEHGITEWEKASEQKQKELSKVIKSKASY